MLRSYQKADMSHREYIRGWEKLPEAVSLRRPLTTAEGSLGAGPSRPLSLNNLAKLYTAMGRYAEAEPLYIRAVELRRDRPRIVSSTPTCSTTSRSSTE